MRRNEGNQTDLSNTAVEKPATFGLARSPLRYRGDSMLRLSREVGMRFHARLAMSALVCCLLIAALVPSAASAAAEVPLVEKLVAKNCKVSTCGQEEVEGFFEPKPVISTEEAVSEGFTQAGGRVPFGITDF